MPVTIERIEDQNLTVFLVTGELKADEQLNAMESFYEGKPTANVLWDFRKVEGARSSYMEVEKMLSYAKSRGQRRVSGKTALLTAAAVDFGLARMTEILSEVKEIPWEVHSFTSLEEAMKWLGVTYVDSKTI
ncbi:MAG: hypothetical protein KJ737_08685 [Proteobacteria bacterium]|nr:hypothetical protein [Pseudomonadota bacterium]